MAQAAFYNLVPGQDRDARLKYRAELPSGNRVPASPSSGAPNFQALAQQKYSQDAALQQMLQYGTNVNTGPSGAPADASGGGGGGVGGWGGPGAIPGVGLRSADQLAKLYGVNIDQAAITKAYQDAVATAYKGANRDYTQNLGNTQASYLDAMRRGNAAALQSGAAKGMQSANELSAMLGLSQQSVGGASKLASDQATASQQAVQEAMAYADQNKLALGQLSTDIYGKDITREGNYMSIAQQYAEMKSKEGIAAADRELQKTLSASTGTTAEDPTVLQWRTLFNKKPGEAFTAAEQAAILKMAPADWAKYQDLNPKPAVASGPARAPISSTDGFTQGVLGTAGITQNPDGSANIPAWLKWAGFK